MRFHPEGPSIPDILLERCDEGRVVFLCGAGVSVPADMPSFVELTRHVIEYFDPPPDSEIMTAFRPWQDKKKSSAGNIPLDQIFNLLHLEYGRDEVNSLVTERLSFSSDIKDFGREHALIKRISSSQRGMPQIVTTNFDRLFEAGDDKEKLAKHEPPAFPELNFGSTIEGITYLHGRLVDATAETHPYVLSSADFGRAYLSEGWATNFVRHLLERYTVVLVGYQAEDPPIKYLLQGLNHDGQYDRSRLYAFDRGSPEEVAVKWRDRGVTAIACAEYDDLWMSLEAWAERADDPRQWRASIIAKSQRDPKSLLPHERGQVAHVLRTVQGARLFSEAEPHPEWVCVLDANVRSAKPGRGYGDDTEVFDPGAAYGLDDDERDISDDQLKQGIANDNLLIWRNGDDNPHDFHRLNRLWAEGFEAIPKRLEHLVTWITNSIDSPVIAWWAIRQNGLHPVLLKQLRWKLDHSQALHIRARHIWNLILEYHREPRHSQSNYDWFDLKARVNTEGWTDTVLREFRRVSAPRLMIKPHFRQGWSVPPDASWEEIHLNALSQCEIATLDKHNEDLDVPDSVVPELIGILEEQFVVAAGMLKDIDAIYFDTPTCYPNREVNGRTDVTKSAEIIIWFVQLFDRMVEKWPKLANAHATLWPVRDQFFFRKLKLYAFSKDNVFTADYVAAEILSFEQEEFWDIEVARELLFLLVDRWDEFSQENRTQIIDRVLTGPHQFSFWSDEEYPAQRDHLSVRYARYLQLQGYKFTELQCERLADMIGAIPDWRDNCANSTVVNWGSRAVRMDTDDKQGTFLHLNASEIVPKLKQGWEEDPGSYSGIRHFAELVKNNPRKALSALTIAGKGSDGLTGLWSKMISEFPSDASLRLKRVFLHRINRHPLTVITELRGTLGRWLQDNLVSVLAFDEKLGWAVYDHLVDGIMDGGEEATKSRLSEVNQGGKPSQQSRRTYQHARNGSVGTCALTLFNAIPRDEHEAWMQIPEHIKHRLERLFTAPGEGADHAISMTTSNLDFFMSADPDWTKKKLIPLLNFEHPAAEPAWHGLFRYQDLTLTSELAELIKPLLLGFNLRREQLCWDPEMSVTASQWIGLMRLFYPIKAGGVSGREMRSVLRELSENARNQFISWLRRVGQDNEDGWCKHVIPLINGDWPRERRFRTSASMKAWIDLLDDTGSYFPSVYEAVKGFLTAVETNDQSFYRFTLKGVDRKSLTVLFPEITLDLMNRTTPQTLTRRPYELSKVLSLIAESQPDLTSDSRYLRLIDLVNRS